MHWGRILELEVHGYAQEWERAAEYGKRWVCELTDQRLDRTHRSRLR